MRGALHTPRRGHAVPALAIGARRVTGRQAAAAARGKGDTPMRARRVVRLFHAFSSLPLTRLLGAQVHGGGGRHSVCGGERGGER